MGSSPGTNGAALTPDLAKPAMKYNSELMAYIHSARKAADDLVRCADKQNQLGVKKVAELCVVAFDRLLNAKSQ